MKDSNLEKMLNIITDLSAEAVVSIEAKEPSQALKQIEMLQSYIDEFMDNNNMRQVTEADTDYEDYMMEAYATTKNKTLIK